MTLELEQIKSVPDDISASKDIAGVKKEIVVLKAPYADIAAIGNVASTSSINSKSACSDLVSKEVKLELSEALEREKRKKKVDRKSVV